MRRRFGVLLASPVLVAGCSNAHDSTAVPTATTAVTQQLSVTEAPAPATIRLIIGGQHVSGQLWGNSTARELAAQLPLTLTFGDLNGVEKNAKLPAPLTTVGAPDGADPEVGDIGYYAPAHDLVLYYGDVGHWNGIVRIGRFDVAQRSFIETRADGFEVILEPVSPQHN